MAEFAGGTRQPDEVIAAVIFSVLESEKSNWHCFMKLVQWLFHLQEIISLMMFFNYHR
ncbi:MAG: hypothetical protein ACLU70_06595 [Lachnospira sp.]